MYLHQYRLIIDMPTSSIVAHWRAITDSFAYIYTQYIFVARRVGKNANCCSCMVIFFQFHSKINRKASSLLHCSNMQLVYVI